MLLDDEQTAIEEYDSQLNESQSWLEDVKERRFKLIISVILRGTRG
jgi:hypothetical protein